MLLKLVHRRVHRAVGFGDGPVGMLLKPWTDTAFGRGRAAIPGFHGPIRPSGAGARRFRGFMDRYGLRARVDVRICCTCARYQSKLASRLAPETRIQPRNGETDAGCTDTAFGREPLKRPRRYLFASNSQHIRQATSPAYACRYLPAVFLKLGLLCCY